MQNFGSYFLTFGPAVVKDEFFASAVHAPLVRLGKTIRQGWTLEHRSDNFGERRCRNPSFFLEKQPGRKSSKSSL